MDKELRKIKELERALRRAGLANKQIEAGIKYYVNFCRRHDIGVVRASKMIKNMIKGMKRRYT